MCQQWGPAPQRGSQGDGLFKTVIGVIVVVALSLAVLVTTGAPKNNPGIKALAKGPTLAGILGGGGLKLPKLEIGNPFSQSRKPSSKARTAARYAMKQRGDRYVYGANGPNAWDCSGLTSGAWRKAGVKIPRTAKGQLRGLKRVKGKPRTGDLIVYRSSVSPSGWHVAIAVGQGQMVEARGRRYGVVQRRIRGGWVGVVRP